MKRTVKLDPWFSKQPPLTFVEELKKPIHTEKPNYYGKREIKENEISVDGLFIATKFCDDPKNLLETIYDDFDKFLKLYEIGGNKFPVHLKKGDTQCFEAYTIEVSGSEITITANDTEGIRRGIIYLEDELRIKEGAFLEEGTIKRVPKLRSRITRCFFSPINRPPKYGDELSDDIDYYPEEYLNRLMHDGTNGVWIYTRFSDLMTSDIIKEYGKGCEPRIQKLNRVIDKCARYGIGVYVFAIEPVALVPSIMDKYPELCGGDIVTSEGKGKTFCASSELGKRFCYEMGKKLVTQCPGLRGVIYLTNGERGTSCASLLYDCTCPRCKKLSLAERLSVAVEALRSGIRDTKPECEFVSFTYGHRLWEPEDIVKYIETVPDDVMNMESFEEMGYDEQLGRERQCLDYWLAYVGPGTRYEASAKRARELGKHTFAKMQVCCSHEIASVPYVPVPGLIYKKYKKAWELGVEGIMQCWYFGNYPCFMSKAAGELAFEDKYNDEEGFLKRLAGIYWGETKAAAVVKAWSEFEKGYSNYPRNIMFSYYGPMHDSVVWKLALKPKNFSLPRSWQSLDPIDGDRISESMLDSHTIDETLTLLEKMTEHWSLGLEIMSGVGADIMDEAEQLSVAKTINILFASAKNIIEFYKLRDQLGMKLGDASAILCRMRELVTAEIENSKNMIPLCEADSRLGYHSEAEGFKFFPEKIRERIEQLNELLITEFAEVEERLEKGLSPLEYYEGVEDNDKIHSYKLTKGSIADGEWVIVDEATDSKFRGAYDDEYFYLEMTDSRDYVEFAPEFKLLWPNLAVSVKADGSVEVPGCGKYYFGLFNEHQDEYLKKYDITRVDGEGIHIIVKVKLSDVGLDTIRPFKMRLDFSGTLWCNEDNPIYTLGKNFVSPGEYGWFKKE